ncbi:MULTISPECIES: hypothetical protein [unclassified Streptomyces]|uniref:hypothetical protein n=1 Tax=unclassified Streptomyces TaxID=2593676 RepID=UPI0035D5B513
MTHPPSPQGSRTLLAVAGTLAATGCALVLYAMPSHHEADAPRTTPSPASATRPAALPSADATPPVTAEPSATPRAVEAAPAAIPSAPAARPLPEPGAGPRADPLVQDALEQALPSDLAPADEAQLTALGRAVWMAELTGAGRSKWPTYFPDSPSAAAYSRVRIQALIARRDNNHPADAMVYLVWAGADPAGTFMDGRTASLRFTRQAEAWTPVR